MDLDLVIDADSHIEEPIEAWDYLDDEYRDRKPRVITVEGRPRFPVNQNAFWLIDGALAPKLNGAGANIFGSPVTSKLAKSKPFSIGSQTMMDVPARLKDLDNYGVKVQVSFPTTLLAPLTDDLGFEAALCRSYNSWLAGVCRQAPDRLKWAAFMPLRSPHEAMKELHRVKQLGAVTATIPGTAGSRHLNDPFFSSFFAEAERLDMPLAIHVGWWFPPLTQTCMEIYQGEILAFTMPLLMGFFAIVGGGVLDRFPNLRIAFWEGGGTWLLYLIERMDQYFSAATRGGWGKLPERKPSEYLKDGNLYISVEGSEKLLPQLVELIGEDQVLASADMPHPEGYENTFNDIRKRFDLSDSAKKKIFWDNPKRFYALNGV